MVEKETSSDENRETRHWFDFDFVLPSESLLYRSLGWRFEKTTGHVSNRLFRFNDKSNYFWKGIST